MNRLLGLEALIPLPPVPMGVAGEGVEVKAGPKAESDEVELGYVSGVFGVRGEVRLFLHHPDSDTLATERRVVFTAPDGRRFTGQLRARSGAGKRILGAIRGVSDPDAAARMMDWTFSIAATDLPEPDDGEYYVFDLEGLDVVVGERVVGTVSAVHETAGGDILEIDAGGREPLFVPIVERFILDVDLDAGRILLAEDALEEP